MSEKLCGLTLSDMSVTDYYKMSEDRKVITPENICGLIEYPALFKAMQDDRELRPALTESMSTGRVMADFMGMSSEDFLKTYIVADGPINPKTGKPYGVETKSYTEWLATQDKTPVSTEKYNMFGKMAEAYNGHASIKSLSGYKLIRNAIVTSNIEGVDCACKVDSLYVDEENNSVWAVDITTTSDLCAFKRNATGMYYQERIALMYLILSSYGVTPQLRIAAIEKGPIPRCGVFAVRGQETFVSDVSDMLVGYANSVSSGVYGTRFEAPALI